MTTGRLSTGDLGPEDPYLAHHLIPQDQSETPAPRAIAYVSAFRTASVSEVARTSSEPLMMRFIT